MVNLLNTALEGNLALENSLLGPRTRLKTKSLHQFEFSQSLEWSHRKSEPLTLSISFYRNDLLSYLCLPQDKRAFHQAYHWAFCVHISAASWMHSTDTITCYILVN